MKIYNSTTTYFVLLLMIVACLHDCTSFPTTTTNPTPTPTNVTSSAAAVQVQSTPTQPPKNETNNQPIKKDKDADDRVMYSYAEAVVDTEGTPSVHQLTIAKGKNGQFHFAKNENGTMKTGNWKGPLPVSPEEPKIEHFVTPAKILGNGISSVVRQDLMDPLTEFNKNIGNTLQDYIFNKLMPLQLTF